MQDWIVDVIPSFAFSLQNNVSKPGCRRSDDVFWDLKSRDVEQILDHLALDVFVQLRSRVETAEERNRMGE